MVIQQMPIPKGVSSLGLISFYSNFPPGLHPVHIPLKRLAKDNKPEAGHIGVDCRSAE